jgi:hypothetical protein
MASSIPGARLALYNALRDLNGSSLNGVRVDLTGTWTEQAEKEVIVVQDARDIDRRAAQLGAQRFSETYTIPVLVEVVYPGKDILAASTRLWQLIAIVEQTVMADVKGTQQVFTRPTRVLPGGIPAGEHTNPLNDRALLSTATLNLACESHVSLA